MSLTRPSKWISRGIALAVLSLSLSVTQPAIADTETTTKAAEKFANPEIALIDRKIMLLCIELSRFNVGFHQSVNQKSFFQQWIYPLEREAGTALSFSNTIIDLAQRAKGLRDLELVSKAAQKTGTKCALTGQAITGSASAAALATNLLHSISARRKGYSPKQTAERVKLIASEIDELLSSRRRILLSPLDIDRKLAAEYGDGGRLLEHLKNQLIFEYKTWSVQSRATEWSENSFYMLDSMQGFTQLASSCISLQAFRDSRLSGAAAITNLAANTVVTLNPIVRTFVSRFIEKKERIRLERMLPGHKPLAIDDVLAELGKDMRSGSREFATTSEEQELAFLIRRSGKLDDVLNKEVGEFVRLRRIADQQAVSGPLIGLTGVTRGILNTTAFYSTLSEQSSAAVTPETSGDSSSQSATTENSDSRNKIISNQLNFAGRIVQATGQAYSLILTPTTEVKHYLYQRKLKRENRSPSQLLNARLATLDALEQRVRTFKY